MLNKLLPIFIGSLLCVVILNGNDAATMEGATFVLYASSIFVITFYALLWSYTAFTEGRIETKMANSIFDCNIQHGRVWIQNGDHRYVGTRSLRIKADGRWLSDELMPGTPIHLHMEAGTIVQRIVAENDLTVHGSIKADFIHTARDILCMGNLTASQILAKDVKLAECTVLATGEVSVANNNGKLEASASAVSTTRRRRRSSNK
jgi:hypothetical protein